MPLPPFCSFCLHFTCDYDHLPSLNIRMGTSLVIITISDTCLHYLYMSLVGITKFQMTNSLAQPTWKAPGGGSQTRNLSTNWLRMWKRCIYYLKNWLSTVRRPTSNPGRFLIIAHLELISTPHMHKSVINAGYHFHSS